MITCCRRPDRC